MKADSEQINGACTEHGFQQQDQCLHPENSKTLEHLSRVGEKETAVLVFFSKEETSK